MPGIRYQVSATVGRRLPQSTSEATFSHFDRLLDQDGKNPARYAKQCYPFKTMFLSRLFSTSFLGLCLATVSLPALARPEIASGDRLLNTNFEGCLAQADRFIESLDVQSDAGPIDRTGYFDDGTFRILCYGTGNESIVIVFASHDSSVDTATTFVQMALESMAQAQNTRLPESENRELPDS